MEQIGVSPKRWLRIERLHRAVAASLTVVRSWSDIAAHCGFADQPHMVREFVDLLGECPTTCSAQLAKQAPGICMDPPGVDRAAVHRQIDADALAFFRRELSVTH